MAQVRIKYPQVGRQYVNFPALVHLVAVVIHGYTMNFVPVYPQRQQRSYRTLERGKQILNWLIYSKNFSANINIDSASFRY